MKINENILMNFAVAITIISVLVFGVSVFNLIKQKSLTGYATDVGQTYVDVVGEANIEFTTNVTGWGSGAVNSTFDNATLDTEGHVTHGNWSVNSQPLYLENQGNVNVSLTLNSDKDANAFIGGSNPEYRLKVSNNEAGSCSGAGNFSSYQSVDTTPRLTCNPFQFNESRNSIRIDINLTIPSDAPPGNKTSIITATAEVA